MFDPIDDPEFDEEYQQRLKEDKKSALLSASLGSAAILGVFITGMVIIYLTMQAIGSLIR